MSPRRCDDTVNSGASPPTPIVGLGHTVGIAQARKDRKSKSTPEAWPAVQHSCKDKQLVLLLTRFDEAVGTSATRLQGLSSTVAGHMEAAGTVG